MIVASIADVPERAAAHSLWSVLAPGSRVVARRDDERVPDDIVRFFPPCEGAGLFAGQPGEVLILRPGEIVPANPVRLSR